MIKKTTYTTPWCELEFVLEEDSFLSPTGSSTLDPMPDDPDTIVWT